MPDVIVRRRARLEGGAQPDVMPRLRINDLYARRSASIGNASLNGAGAGRGQPAGARWFMKNILQRFDTILRVSQAIVERQKAFFTPRRDRDEAAGAARIADELGPARSAARDHRQVHGHAAAPSS